MILWVYNRYGYSEMMLRYFHPSAEVRLVENFLQHPEGTVARLLHRLWVPCVTSLLRWGVPKGICARLLAPLYPGRYLSQLLSLQAGDSVLAFDVTNPRTIRLLLAFLPTEVTFHDFFHNPMVPNAPLLCNKALFHKLQQEGARFSTFDPKDAADFHMPFHGQFYYRPEASELNLPATYDFFFCGLPKDREAELLRLQSYLQQQGFTCKFIFPHTYAERLTPEQYIDYVRHSRCILDMNQQGQQGLSRRPLEALFYQKKLLTNNIYVKECDFYRPENICLLPVEKDWHQIVDFLNLPMQPVAEQVTAKYEMSVWVERFA